MADPKILIVDDDANICELLRLYLQKNNYTTAVANDGLQAISLVKTFEPDLILLDVMMPKLDGWQVCREIRKEYDTPIIMITAKGEIYDRVLGFDLGADDYICKPFDMKEVIARIKAVLRRSADKSGDSEVVVKYDKLIINLTNYEMIVDGKHVPAPPKELELIYFLASNPNRVFSRDQLLNEVWGFDYYPNSRTVDVHIKRLREKLENVSPEWSIQTVFAVGYKFEVK